MVLWNPTLWLQFWEASEQILCQGERREQQRHLLESVLKSSHCVASERVSDGETSSSPVACCVNVLALLSSVPSSFRHSCAGTPSSTTTSSTVTRSGLAAVHCHVELPLLPLINPQREHSSSSPSPQQPSRRLLVIVIRSAREAFCEEVLDNLPHHVNRACPIAAADTSARVLLQTDLVARLRWRHGLPALTSSAAGGDATATSKSGVVDAWFVPGVRWIRHGFERGFELLSHEERRKSFEMDVLALASVASSAGQHVQEDMCRKRLCQSIQAALLLQHEVYGGPPVDVLLDNVSPTMDAARRRSVGSSQMWNSCLAAAVSQLPSQLVHSVLTGDGTSVSSNPRVFPAAAKDSSSNGKPAVSKSEGSAEGTTKANITTAAEEDEDRPLWERYSSTTTAQSKATVPLPPVGDATANSSSPPARLIADQKLVDPATQGFEVLFVEVPDESSAQMLVASSAIRSALVDWFEPMLQREGPAAAVSSDAAVTSVSVTTSSAADDNAHGVPERTVVFLCRHDYNLSPLLVGWCRSVVPEHVRIPYVLVVSEKASAANMAELPSPTTMTVLDDKEVGAAYQRMVDFVATRIPIRWEGSLVVAATDALASQCRSMRSARKAAGRTVTHEANVVVVDYAELQRMPATAAALKLVPPSFRQAPVAAATDLGGVHHVAEPSSISSLEAARRRVLVRHASRFGDLVEELLHRPRRPEIAITAVGSGIRFGVARPPTSSMLTCVVGGTVHHRALVSIVTLTDAELSALLGALRVIYAEEYRVAIDVLEKYRRMEQRRELTRPYLQAFCATALEIRRFKICAVVRVNLFVEVELNLQYLGEVQRLLDAAVAVPKSHIDREHDSRQDDGDAGWAGGDALVQQLEKRLIPVLKCKCEPRAGERPPRVLPNGCKLCRHTLQVIFEFLHETKRLSPPPQGRTNCGDDHHSVTGTQGQSAPLPPPSTQGSRRIIAAKNVAASALVIGDIAAAERKRPRDDATVADAGVEPRLEAVDFAQRLCMTSGLPGGEVK